MFELGRGQRVSTHGFTRMQVSNGCARRDGRDTAGTIRGVEARSIRRLLMLTLLTTLVLSPTAFAASSEGAVGSLASTVDQTVGAASDVTGQVTTTVETALPPAQPVTSTAQHVTTDLTQQVTTAVEKVTPVAGRVRPVVEEAAASVDDAASGVAHESRAAKPPAASPGTPPGSVHSPDRERTSVRDIAVPVRTDPAPRHPAESRRLAGRSGSEKDGRELLATSRPPEAPSASPAARTYPGDGVLEAGPSAPGHDVPAMAGGSASAASGGAAVAGLALLAVAFCLTAPRLLRSLLAGPANMRPVIFVSALERPG
jgi:hypothetical protein